MTFAAGQPRNSSGPAVRYCTVKGVGSVARLGGKTERAAMFTAANYRTKPGWKVLIYSSVQETGR